MAEFTSKPINNEAGIVLYKYLSSDHDYFDNELLRFSQQSALNDPFECAPGLSDEEFEEQKQTILAQLFKQTNPEIHSSPEFQEIIKKICNHTKQVGNRIPWQSQTAKLQFFLFQNAGTARSCGHTMQIHTGVFALA